MSPKFFSPGCGGQQGLWELAVVFKMAGRKKTKKKKERNKNELSSIQLGEGTITLQVRDLFIKGFLPLWIERKSHSSSACEFFYGCVCLHVCVYNWCRKVCLLIRLLLSRAAKERWHFSFLISSFIPFSFLLPVSVPDYLVVIQIKELIVLSLVLHALEIHPVP